MTKIDFHHKASMRWIAEAVSALKWTYLKYGSPDVPTGDMVTIQVPETCFATVCDIGEWSGEESDICDYYNECVVELFSLIGYEHWTKNSFAVPADPKGKWLAYAEEAEEYLLSWLGCDCSGSAWDQFNQHHPFDDITPTEEIPRPVTI